MYSISEGIIREIIDGNYVVIYNNSSQAVAEWRHKEKPEDWGGDDRVYKDFITNEKLWLDELVTKLAITKDALVVFKTENWNGDRTKDTAIIVELVNYIRRELIKHGQEFDTVVKDLVNEKGLTVDIVRQLITNGGIYETLARFEHINHVIKAALVTYISKHTEKTEKAVLELAFDTYIGRDDLISKLNILNESNKQAVYVIHKTFKWKDNKTESILITSRPEHENMYFYRVNGYHPDIKYGGGKAVGKVRVLGRERKVIKQGRTQYITYQKQLIKLSDARKLEKQLKKKKQTLQ